MKIIATTTGDFRHETENPLETDSSSGGSARGWRPERIGSVVSITIHHLSRDGDSDPRIQQRGLSGRPRIAKHPVWSVHGKKVETRRKGCDPFRFHLRTED